MTDGWTETDGQTTDKVIPISHFAGAKNLNVNYQCLFFGIQKYENTLKIYIQYIFMLCTLFLFGSWQNYELLFFMIMIS